MTEEEIQFYRLVDLRIRLGTRQFQTLHNRIRPASLKFAPRLLHPPNKLSTVEGHNGPDGTFILKYIPKHDNT